MTWLFGRHTKQATMVPQFSFEETRKSITREFDAFLDGVIAIFGTPKQLFVELLAVAPERTLITLALRPDNSSALPILLKHHQFFVELAFDQSKPIVHEVHNPKDEPQPRLLTTQAIVAIPLQWEHETLAILNIESTDPQLIHADWQEKVQQCQPILTNMIARLATPDAQALINALTQPQVLLERIHEQVLSIIDPQNAESVYHQVLQVAASLVNAVPILGAIHLLRDEAGHLATNDSEQKRWVVCVARFGSYNASEEWLLSGEASITQRAIISRLPQLVNDTSRDPDYKSVAGLNAPASELVVPLIDYGESIGMIDLYCPHVDAFADQDKATIRQFASFIVDAIKRTDEIALQQREHQRLALVLGIEKQMNRLFVSAEDSTPITHKTLLQKIVEWAARYTDSTLGMIALPLTDNHGQHLITVESVGETAEDVIGLDVYGGISGKAYLTHENQVIQDVHSPDQPYITVQPTIESELAIPLIRGNLVVGVLNLESNRRHHYTRIHEDWGNFLAEQIITALTALDLAQKSQHEAQIAMLRQLVQFGLDKMREQTEPTPESLMTLQLTRDELLQQSLQQACALTNSSYGIIRLLMNSVGADQANDRYVVAIKSYPIDQLRDVEPFFSVSAGITGEAIRSEQSVVYNTLPEHFYATLPGITAAMTVPLFSGDTIVGVMNLESVELQCYTNERQRMALQCGRIISDVLTAASVRLSELQLAMLRKFDQAILRVQTQTAQPQFIDLALRYMRELVGINDGWGGITFIRKYQGVYHEWQQYAMLYRDGQAVDASRQMTGRAELDYPTITAAAYQTVLETGHAILILDTHRQPAMSAGAVPWTEARSVICAALLLPEESDLAQNVYGSSDIRAAPGEQVFALLAIASPKPLDLNESDRGIMIQFAEALTLGLQNLSTLDGRANFIREFSHTFTIGYLPLEDRIDDLRENLLDAASTPHERDAHLAAAIASLDAFADVASLLRDLTSWFFTLSDIVEDDDPNIVQTRTVIADIVAVMRQPLDVLAQIRQGGERHVNWEVGSAARALVAGDPSQIKAALFEYINNALKRDFTHDPRVVISLDGTMVMFAVHSFGQQVPKEERHLLFLSRFRASNNSSTTAGQGIGLYQIARIISTLKGTVNYEARDSDENIFSFTIPVVYEGDSNATDEHISR